MVAVPFRFRRDLFKFSRDHGNTFQKISQNFFMISGTRFMIKLIFWRLRCTFYLSKSKRFSQDWRTFWLIFFSFADLTFAPLTKNIQKKSTPSTLTKNQDTLFIKTALKKKLLNQNQPQPTKRYIHPLHNYFKLSNLLKIKRYIFVYFVTELLEMGVSVVFVFKSVIEILIFDSKAGVKVAGRVDFFLILVL